MECVGIYGIRLEVFKYEQGGYGCCIWNEAGKSLTDARVFGQTKDAAIKNALEEIIQDDFLSENL